METRAYFCVASLLLSLSFSPLAQAQHEVGPDVIVGDLPAVQRWGRVGDVTAYSVATTSCNVGDERLNWFSETNQHPVIAQNMYRLKDGQFEQIGQSWLKHGFFALSGSLCTPCNDPTNGTQLGVGCSDPYSSDLNGQQSNLGPRHDVNPSTGFFPYPFSAQNPPATIGRRLQVHDADLNPTLNTGALYFVEGHYISPDDAAAGNQDNNASYRRVTVSVGGANVWNVNVASGSQTVRMKPAIYAWRDNDPSVSISTVNVPGDRQFIMAYKVTSLPNGMWHYEYAIHNLNSHRGAGSFRIPVPSNAVVENISFRDVDSHSGAPYSLTDWQGVFANGEISWSTEAHSVNPNANAIRWGTMYNFRFDTNAPPANGNVTLGLFRPGTPTEMAIPAKVPDTPLAIVASNPIHGAIDARQPFNIDGSNPQGWQFVQMSFTNYALNLTPADFTIETTGGASSPSLMALLPIDENVVNAVLIPNLVPGNRTTIRHAASNTSITLSYLPGDVNGDGTSSPADILSLIDSLNGVVTRSNFSTDIDRSGVMNPADILREIDLLNGAGEFPPYNGMTLQ